MYLNRIIIIIIEHIRIILFGAWVLGISHRKNQLQLEMMDGHRIL